MSSSDTDTSADENSPQSTYAVDYEGAVTLPDDVSLSQTEAVTAVTETLAGWAAAETAHVREFRGVEYDPQRPALHVSVRVAEIPGSTAPDVGYTAIQSLLDDLGTTLDAEFGAARDVGEIR